MSAIHTVSMMPTVDPSGRHKHDATFKADLEKLLKNEGHMPEDKYLLISRKGKRLGVAYASTPPGKGGAGSLKFNK